MRSPSLAILPLVWALISFQGLSFIIHTPSRYLHHLNQKTLHPRRIHNDAQIGVLNTRNNDSDETIDPIDMSQLQSRIKQQQNRYRDFLLSDDDEVKHRPNRVHIIVFNPGTDQQGVHTIEFPLGSGLQIILAFESQDDCENFIAMLKDEKSLQFQNAMSAESPLEELEEFCESCEMLVKVVPRGKDLRPPSENVEDLSFDPTLVANPGRRRPELEDEDVGDEDDVDDTVQFMDSWQ